MLTKRSIGAGALLAAAQFANGQCVEQWQAMPGVSGGASPGVFAMTGWDADGDGPLAPVVIVAGAFTSAGGVAANNIAAWDGAHFSPLGTGLDGEVYSLAALPSGALVAAGGFPTAGGIPVGYIAQWDGASWSSLAGGMNNGVNALTEMPNGDLVAGGFFTTAGGVPANRVARWNGAGWSALGSGMNNIVYAVRGTVGDQLVAGGMFTTAGGTLVNRIARWNGSAWVGMGGANSNVLSLSLLSNGDLIVGGQFTLIGTTAANRIARYSSDGVWSNFGTGVQGVPRCVAEAESGDLIIGGQFFSPTSNIARWNGSGWSSLGTGTDSGVFGFHTEPNGDVIVGGLFQTAGSIPSQCLARWAAAAPPHISVQPSAITRCGGSTATFSIAARGSEPLTYAWFRDGRPLLNGPTGTGSIISGATSADLAISNVSDADEGSYACTVSNACGDTPSRAATLDILAGDLNTDGRIDLSDLATLLSHFGTASGASMADGDLNNDRAVDLSDLAALLSAFGMECP